jgi:hypothetical protein
MKEDRAIWWWVAGVCAAAIALGGWWWWSSRTPPAVVAEAPAPAPVAPAEPATAEPAKSEHPIEAAPAAQQPTAAETLPSLAESDSVLRAALGGLVGEPALVQFFQMTGIASRFVATVDNLPRSRVSTKILPVRGPGGAFIVVGTPGEQTIGADNAGRYAAHLALLEAVDAKRAAALYVRFYPLLEQAYRDLGYPQGHFNDRLVAVIDHLLATPQVEGPIRVVQPKVLFEFADPDLEARSAGQKLLLRMGAANAARVKSKLREFRAEITSAPPPQ